MKISKKNIFACGLLVSTAMAFSATAQAQASDRAQKVFDFWTPERIAQAQPRDLYIDHRGLGYTKNKKGDFVPYGKNKEKYQPMRPGNGNGGGGGGGGKPGGGGGSPDVGNAEWTFDGAVQTAAGRLLYQFGGSYYVCSGTAATDNTSGRSIIITAAHCVYDDTAKEFASNVLFIPNQADGGSATDTNCNNDPLGCWAPSFGVVEENWANKSFPANIPWDYAYYVVSDSGAHSGAGQGGALDQIAGNLPIDFGTQSVDLANDDDTAADWTHGLGYSYDDDPNFMYCADNMTEKADYTLPGSNEAANWWIPVCDLSGGSSGGPWAQPMDQTTGTGSIMSVNSWGYTRKNLKGMAGPKLVGTTAECLFDEAKSANLGTQNLIVDPTSCPGF